MKTVMSDPAHRVKWLLAGILLVAVLLFAVKDLLTQRAAPVWDAIDFYAPYFSLVADHARASQLLKWDPWLDGGLPDFADPQAGASSPIILLFALVFPNPFHGFIAYWITMWAFGGVGMLLFCRYLKAPVWGGAVVSLGFMACGFYTGHGEHTSTIYSLSFIPWILWRFDVSLVRRDYWTSAEAGLLWGLSALGGYPELVILDVMFLVAWALGRLVFQRDDISPDAPRARLQGLVFALLSLVLLGTVGSIILSPPYYSFFRETRGFTSRTTGVDRHTALTSNDLPPKALTTLSSPSLYLLNLPPHGIWPETDVSTSNVYLGVLPLIFGALALLKPSKWRIWLTFVGAFFLCCSVGDHLPLRGWVYDFVLPTRYFRHASLFAIYAAIVLCVLAAYATRDLEEGWSSNTGSARGLFCLLAFAIALTALLCYRHVLHGAGLNFCRALYPSFHAGVAWFSAVLISVFAWRRAFGQRLLLGALVALAVFDAGSTLYISRPTVFSPYTVPWWNTMMSRHKTDLDLTSSGLLRNLHPSEELGTYPNDRNAVVKKAGFVNDTGLTNEFFQQFAYYPDLNKFATGSNRIWFSANAIWTPPTQKAFSEFTSTVKQLNAPVLLLHTREQMLSTFVPAESGTAWASQAQSMVPADVRLTSYRPNTMTFLYRASENGWLLVTDRWARSWTATVNGKPQEVLGADFIFRAVPVTKGENSVVFRYNPTWYVSMVVLSWVTILLCLMIAIWRVVRNKAGHGAEESASSLKVAEA
jgi:hypothetical protein